MSWLQITLLIPANQSETVESVLQSLNALAITYTDAADQPLFEPGVGETPLWNLTRITGLFPDSKPERLIDQIKQKLNFEIPIEMHWEKLDDQNWERAWLQHFKPMKFGSQLWIIPETFTAPDPDAVNIYLDPGLAFGTGTHETTALCLNWLALNPPKNLSVIDFGCGSGILAIAAAKLGAKKILAIDIDPQAISATRDNSLKNRVEDKVEVSAQLTDPDIHADLVIANILAKPLIELAPLFAKLLNPGTTLVMSGLLASQAAVVIKHYQSYFSEFSQQKSADWILLSCRRLV